MNGQTTALRKSTAMAQLVPMGCRQPALPGQKSVTSFLENRLLVEYL
jgi:hypothetical protein